MNATDVVPLTADPTLEYYEKQAAALLEACRSVNHDSAKHVQTYHPEPERFLQLNRPDTNFGIDDARAVLAREHGFENWGIFTKHVADLKDPDSQASRFERAVEAAIQGDLPALQALLQANPELVRERSSRGHRATLLHYLAANGVENFRQLTPSNALEVMELLLSAGAEPDALADTYDTKWGTTLELLVSSCHPAKAGLQSVLAEKLLDYGAAVDGVRDNGGPLLTAIYFHYPEAAETLVKRGARIDNVVTAAAMGKTGQLAGYLDESGTLKPDAPLVNVEWLEVDRTPEANLALAFVWAAMLNRVETVRFLLENGVSPASKDPRDWTALHWAAYFAHPDIVSLLLAYKAPLEARNEFGGTVLDQTLWATANEGVRQHHLEVVQQLVNAKAKIHSWWLLDDLRPPLPESVSRILQEKV